MSLTLNDDFSRSGFDVIACHSPLVLDVTLQNANATAVSGDVTAKLYGVGVTINTTEYTFDMGYAGSSGSGPYDHEFRLDVTDIIRRICNVPDLRDETTSGYKYKPLLGSGVLITIASAGESDDYLTKTYMHGFNQVNDPNSSCLVELANKQAIISIVPGAPMLFYQWLDVSTPSTNNEMALITEAGSAFKEIAMAFTLSGGLHQFNEPTDINLEFYNQFTQHEFFSMAIREATTHVNYQVVYAAAYKKACEGDVVLAWLNRFGMYSYMVFDKRYSQEVQGKHIGSYDISIDDLADVQSRKLSRGYEGVYTVIDAIANQVPITFFPAIEDLFYSMDVYMFTGTLPSYNHQDVNWVRVTVSGSMPQRKKHNHENIRVTIKMPEKYTQLR